jgi:2-isopropylmalate synthase
MSFSDVKIIDGTLREGMQAPGVSFKREESREIARYLAYLGVDTIECGHASVSAAELRRIQEVVELGLRPPVLVHARAHRGDIYAVAASGAPWVGIFCGINEMSLRTRVKRSGAEELIGQIEDAISYARGLGLKVRYTIEDASRTSLDLMLRTYASALAAGANRICFADTLGMQDPVGISRVIGELRSAFPTVDIEAHVHDDRGLALACALAAVEAGANWISTSVNGLGERCGIVDLAALLANLHYLGARRIEDPVALQKLSEYVAASSRAFVDHRRPVVGRNAFTHRARLHVRAVEADEMAYSWLPPSDLGRKTEIARPHLPDRLEALVTKPLAIPATELRYHREGPGTRYVMVDERVVPDARQYCIVRHIPTLTEPVAGHVDEHRHSCDSLFLFVGENDDLTGLEVEVRLGSRVFPVVSPASVFIPASVSHSYRVVSGGGYFVNHVLAGEYNASLLEPHAALKAWAAQAARPASRPTERAQRAANTEFPLPLSFSTQKAG